MHLQQNLLKIVEVLLTKLFNFIAAIERVTNKTAGLWTRDAADCHIKQITMFNVL